MSDLILVASENGVLILPRGRSQGIKKLIATMKSTGGDGRTALRGVQAADLGPARIARACQD